MALELGRHGPVAIFEFFVINIAVFEHFPSFLKAMSKNSGSCGVVCGLAQVLVFWYVLCRC